MTYYNTNKETGETLEKSEVKTKSQEAIIMNYVEIAYYGNDLVLYMAPHALKSSIKDFQNVPLTSIRRAITNLEKIGMLKKTNRMVRGTYGKMVHTWNTLHLQEYLN